jgi:hypothetical protein
VKTTAIRLTDEQILVVAKMLETPIGDLAAAEAIERGLTSSEYATFVRARAKIAQAAEDIVHASSSRAKKAAQS